MDASCNSYMAAVGETAGVKLQRVVRIAVYDGCCVDMTSFRAAADVIIFLVVSSSIRRPV